MSTLTAERKLTAVVPDSVARVMFSRPAVTLGRDPVILTVRDDATHEQRIQMAQEAARIRAADHPAPSRPIDLTALAAAIAKAILDAPAAETDG